MLHKVELHHMICICFEATGSGFQDPDVGLITLLLLLGRNAISGIRLKHMFCGGYIFEISVWAGGQLHVVFEGDVHGLDLQRLL